jgi:coenzyme Q-binding protein COQ10
VESVGGGTQTSLREQEIAHHLGDEGDRSGGNGDTGSLLSHLRNRWTVEPLGKDQTRVTLALEYAFTNPLYSALSAGAAPMVADIMVKAFEQRARSMLENDPEMRNASLEDLDGSQIKKR